MEGSRDKGGFFEWRGNPGLFKSRGEGARSKRRVKDMEQKSYDGGRDGLEESGLNQCL